MKKILSTLLILGCVTTLTVNAQEAEKKKKELSPEAKALQKEMVGKYDANKDGKLDKEERGKISTEDKAKMEKAGLGGDKKKKAE